MEFRIANTFQDSLNRLTAQEQKAVKTAAFDLQLNPAHPSLHFHRIEQAKDPNFWSARVSRDLRLIIHKTAASLLLCFVGHHDAAYDWAQRRKIERHPRTGAAQLVEIRERVAEIPVYQPVNAPAPAAKPLLFDGYSDDTLLSYGVPEEWLLDVRQADEDSLFTLVEHLPQESAEALLELATGGQPVAPEPIPADSDPFAHPDAQRRFRVLTNVAELERALDYPWEKWTVFLHPAQRHLVERSYSGPARVSGSAGTGKTVVALHRAVFLARQHPAAQIVLTTFSVALANALNVKLLRLIGNETAVRERIQIHAMTELGYDLYATLFGPPRIAPAAWLHTTLQEIAAQKPDTSFTGRFLFEEWTAVVDAWQLDTWESYQNVPRLGRKTRLGWKQREQLWQIFQQVRTRLAEQGYVTWPLVYRRVAENVIEEGGKRPYDFAIVDEAQDLGVAELRFLAALGGQRPDDLFFAGDLGQRIFQPPFSWKNLGVDVRGRSYTLAINYRTSHQIRQQADRLLPHTIADVDGNVEERQGTISVFNGLPPVIDIFVDEGDEITAVGDWLIERLAEGMQPEEIGVFVRSAAQLERARQAVSLTGAEAAELDDRIAPPKQRIAISTMHLAKGLEFRAVAVMACDDEVLPLQSRMETVADISDLEEVYNTERHLLYVACTRARDYLLITGVDPASEFLDDLVR